MDIIEIAREILEKAVKATPRPWTIGKWDDDPDIAYPILDTSGDYDTQHWVPQDKHYECGLSNDAAYIASVCNNAPALAQAVIEQREEIERLSEELSHWQHGGTILSRQDVEIREALAAANDEIIRQSAQIANLREGKGYRNARGVLPPGDVPAEEEIARLREVERKAIGQSEYIQSHGLTEYELARLRSTNARLEGEHDTLVDIQDWITINANEYNDGELSDLEIIQNIYKRLHDNITEVEPLWHLEEQLCTLVTSFDPMAKLGNDLVDAITAELTRLREVERKAIAQSNYIQAHGLTEYELARLHARIVELEDQTGVADNIIQALEAKP